jgi:hypothetical protein
MKRFAFGLIVTLFVGVSWAQNKDAATASQSAPQDQTQPAPEKKTKDKKKKEKAKPNDEINTEVFSDAAANQVLSDLRDGLEGHIQRLMLSAFDADKMDGYLNFEDQIDAFFNRYASFTVHYRIVQASIEKERGILLVDFGMEEIPRSSAGAPQRKSGQIRFELERGRKGWKIVDFTPRNFFS